MKLNTLIETLRKQDGIIITSENGRNLDVSTEWAPFLYNILTDETFICHIKKKYNNSNEIITEDYSSNYLRLLSILGLDYTCKGNEETPTTITLTKSSIRRLHPACVEFKKRLGKNNNNNSGRKLLEVSFETLFKHSEPISL